jgi:peptidoglycan endopeptidase LytE
MRRTTRTFRLALASLTVAVSMTAVGVPASPAAAAPAPSSSSTGTYVVKQDDTFFGIAKKLGVSMNALLAANAMTVNSVIHPGMVLVVPAGATASLQTTSSTSSTSSTSPAGRAPATTYVVQANDALFNIARKYGVSLNGLLQANNLEIDSVVLPGRTLTIPAGGSVAVSPSSGSGQNSSGQATPTAAPAATAGAGTYVVQAGDSIYGIASKHGLKYGPLLKANGLTLESVLAPGRTLTIPAGGTLAISPSLAASGQANSAASAAAARIDTVVAYAKAQLGKPWVFAAAGPDSFDCSGLTMMAYRQIGIGLPHSSVLQSARGVAVDWFTQDIQAGDLIFMASSNAPGVIGHVGIAIDSKRWIHSPENGDVVRQGFIPADSRLMAVRRFVTV